MGKVFLIVTSVISLIIGKVAYDIFSDGEVPVKLLAENYKTNFWGPVSLQGKEDTKIYPFKINVPDATLTSLKSQLNSELNSGRLTPPLENTGFDYGFNTEYFKKVMTYWKDKYDWRAREKILNQFPQFKTKIEGLDIHFQHVKSSNNQKYKKTLPLILLHGWPGSFVELQKMIPLLTDPKDSDFNFEVVVPSLPGYGFSGYFAVLVYYQMPNILFSLNFERVKPSKGSVRPGLGPLEMAQIFLKLMQRLNHLKFYAHGGDWGSIIISHMAAAYPENVIAMHSNMCLTMHPRSFLKLLANSVFPEFLMSAEEAQRYPPLSHYFEFMMRETGYAHIQATKPDTVGVGLSLSPSGLAAYILEKFSTWTNKDGIKKVDGDLTNKFTMDELLDNIMVYWVTNSITTSMRLYAENFSKTGATIGFNSIPVKVPTGCIVAGNDPHSGQTEWILKDKYQNLIRYKLEKGGGHFYALEHPQEVSQDLFAFIQQVQDLQKKK